MSDPICRGFVHSSAAWYWPAIARTKTDTVDEVMFGDYPAGGGTRGEMAVRWVQLGGRPVPKLECYGDAFASSPPSATCSPAWPPSAIP